MSDPINTIGKYLDETAQRDAVHIALCPAYADEELVRGHPVVLIMGTNRVKKGKRGDVNVIGIVDPFLADYYIPKDSRVNIFLYPNTVTGMRHHYKHPIIDESERIHGAQTEKVDVSEAEEWLQEFANRYYFSYGEMIQEAKRGGTICAGTDFNRCDIEDESIFWEHMEKLTGLEFSEEHRVNTSWRCAC